MRFFIKSFGVDELSGGSVGWNKQSLFAPECELWAAAGSIDTDLSFHSFLELYRT